MSVRQFTPWSKRGSEDGPKPAFEENAARHMTLLVEGAAMNTPVIDDSAYSEFRARVTQLALQMRDGLPDDDKLALIRSVLREFEQHHKASQDALRDRLAAWRTLGARLLIDLFSRMGMDSASAEAAPMVQRGDPGIPDPTHRLFARGRHRHEEIESRATHPGRPNHGQRQRGWTARRRRRSGACAEDYG